MTDAGVLQLGNERREAQRHLLCLAQLTIDIHIDGIALLYVCQVVPIGYAQARPRVDGIDC